MNGLIIKDLITLEKQKISTIAGLLFTTIAFLLFWQSTGALLLGAVVLPFLTIFTPFTFRASDEQWKWDTYAISLPVSKKQIVASRYLSCSIISIAYFLFSLALNIGVYFWFQDHSITLHLASAFIGLGVSLLFGFLILPTSFTKGLEVSVWVLVILAIIFIGVVVIIKKANFDIFSLSPTPSQITLLMGLSVATLIGIFIGSYLVSVAMYRKLHS